VELFGWLTSEFLGKDVWLWLVFLGIVVTLLVFDLGVLGRRRGDHEMGVKESLVLSGFYITIALLYGVWIFWYMGSTSGIQYFTGFFIEKTLALDNVFVISLIFAYFAIPRKYQHRVLFWGIIGVLILRGIMIGLGAALVTQFDWILYIFGAFLLFTGVKMLFSGESEMKSARWTRFFRLAFWLRASSSRCLKQRVMARINQTARKPRASANSRDRFARTLLAY
jgi:tellurite resistance protein TerC